MTKQYNNTPPVQSTMGTGARTNTDTGIEPRIERRTILRMPEVERRTGYKRAHIYNLIKEGKFPKNVKIGIRAVGWDSYAIDRWIEEQIGYSTV